MYLLTLLTTYWYVALAVLLAYHVVNNYTYNGLQKYPSAHPIAGFTDWWRLLDVLSRKAEKTHIAVHREKGNIVRLGPKTLSFADPAAIKTIYGLNKGMTKSDFYPVQAAISKGKRIYSLFSTQDETYHAKYKRCVNAAFSMSNLVSYEPLVESTLDVFLEQTMSRYVDTGKTCNFSQWLQFFAFDVIGELTWSKRLGFVEHDKDVDSIVEFVGDFLTYCAPVGQIPWLDLIWRRNPLRLKLQELDLSKTVFAVTKFAQDRAVERAAGLASTKKDGVVDEESGKGVDLLAKFTQAQHDHPEFMTDNQVLASCTSMILAGSETTAISLSSVFYHVLKHPRTYQKLIDELDDAIQDGSIETRSNGKVSWADSQKLPYLDAVIQESFRIHPAPGLILERVTPLGGMTICGEHIPGGTIVGCNPWVVHRNQEVFGTDADAFRPERWLEAKPDQLREMKASMFQFGAGPRTCIGKNISLLEIYKLIPTFLLNFHVELARPNEDWRTHNAWFVRPLNFEAKFSKRTKSQVTS
ncbi:hypothetical protein BT93_L4246 [Corymbia citriodora subsp. variegata]|uniref:Cytochrome P450 n=1 Tax=Corymbia citriodora subsp. variegata TaxID=360336 RepID=A0A8T0CG19_CORYI|nr:hypothetical protein BT93_L4246 [Corymbia citriodora subsp. variegata]